MRIVLVTDVSSFIAANFVTLFKKDKSSYEFHSDIFTYA
jgi:hypothetical protein